MGGPWGCPGESRPRRTRQKKQRLGGGTVPEQRWKMASEVTGWAEEPFRVDFTPVLGCGQDTCLYTGERITCDGTVLSEL